MATGKRYYWLKLKEDFFRGRDIKKLRSMAGGDTLTLIYLEMLLLALRTDGKLEYTGLEDDFASEIALTIDENPDDVSSVVNFLTKRGLLVECNQDEYELTAHASMVGSECDSAERVRRHREKAEALHCNAPVTKSNTEIEIEKEKEKDQEREKTTTPYPLQGNSGGGGGGFSPEILAYARERARGANNPAAYEAAILDRIRKAGFKTIEEVKAADEDRQKRSTATPGPVYAEEDDFY